MSNEVVISLSDSHYFVPGGFGFHEWSSSEWRGAFD